jgi:hypothetical protein
VARREDHPPPTSRPRGGAGVVFRLSCLTAPAQCMRWRCGAMIGFGPPIGIADRLREGPCHSPREQPAGSRSLPRDRPPDRRVHGTTDPGHHKHHPTQGELSQQCTDISAPQSLYPLGPTQTFRPIENSATGSAMLAEGTAVGADRPSSARVGALVSAIQLSGLAAAPTAAVAVATIDLRLPSQPVPQVARGSAEFLQRTPSS